QAFLPLDADGKAVLHARERKRVALREGEGIVVSIDREAARAKSPVAGLMETGHDGETPQRVGRHQSDEELLLANPASPELRDRLDALVEEALSRTAPVPGGGVLTIEPTAALVAIDVDAGARTGSGDPERFALDLNIAAAKEAARQVRLRN